MKTDMILYALVALVLLFFVFRMLIPAAVRPQADADQKTIQGMSLMTTA